MTSVDVIGAGVIGLTTSLVLAREGHQVRCLYREPWHASVSAVAGGIWFPYQTETSERSHRLLARSLETFRKLEADPSTGVDERYGLWVSRAGADLSWRNSLASTEAPVALIPAGAEGAYRAGTPIVDMPTYMPWLHQQATEAGVIFERRNIRDAYQASAGDAHWVIVAAGEGSAQLLEDPDMFPIRGQIMRLKQPEDPLQEWFVDDLAPHGSTYVIPRRTDVIVGGTAEIGETTQAVDAATSGHIMSRALRAVSRLGECEPIDAKVGLRPARPTLRIEEVEYPNGGSRLVGCYGHGGAGVTLSWGSAYEVARLVARGQSVA